MSLLPARRTDGVTQSADCMRQQGASGMTCVPQRTTATTTILSANCMSTIGHRNPRSSTRGPQCRIPPRGRQVGATWALRLRLQQTRISVDLVWSLGLRIASELCPVRLPDEGEELSGVGPASCVPPCPSTTAHEHVHQPGTDMIHTDRIPIFHGTQRFCQSWRPRADVGERPPPLSVICP